MTAHPPAEMISYYFEPSLTSPAEKNTPVPQPEPDEVLLRVLAAGLCHSDVGLFDHDAIIYQLLSSRGSWSCGHEGAGK